MKRRISAVLALAVAAFGLPTGSPAVAAPVTSFWVYRKERADLTDAAKVTDKRIRTQQVYAELRSTATESQRDLRTLLDGRKARYSSYWIANAVRVTGDQALRDAIAARSDVASVEPARTYQAPQPVAKTAAAAGDPTAWGVSDIGAPAVWDEYADRGQGIVVANIDTGVDVTHPALAAKYRGATTGSDHNCFDATGTCPDPAKPCDDGEHGTHTMGTMVGDTIGVAPGATFIAAKGCGVEECTDAALLAAGQWILAPADGTDRTCTPQPGRRPRRQDLPVRRVGRRQHQRGRRRRVRSGRGHLADPGRGQPEPGRLRAWRSPPAKVYLIGGCVASCRAGNATTVFDPATGTFSAGPAYPHNVAWQGCGALGRLVHCAGGNESPTTFGDMWILDTAKGTWTAGPDLPTPVYAAQTTMAGGLLVLAGGLVNDKGAGNQVVAYDPLTGKWLDLPPLPYARYRGAAACGAYVLGGKTLDYEIVSGVSHLPGLGDCGTEENVPWLTQQPADFTLAPGKSRTLILTLTAPPTPGKHSAQLVLLAGTPYPAPVLPVTMTVIGKG